MKLDYSKKGLIVIGSARSGSHMACSMFYHSAVAQAINLGEIYATNEKDLEYLNSVSQNGFTLCSIVNFMAKNRLAANLSQLKNYQLVNVRRKNKIDQYISWCVYRAQQKSNRYNHSPIWEDVEKFLPWEVTIDDLDRFIAEQNIDFAFQFDSIFYYEDLINSNNLTTFKKNKYPIANNELVSNYTLVQEMLENYSYEGR